MPLHPKEVLVTKDGLAQPSYRATSFFHPYDGPGVGERDFSQVVTQLHQLTGPISPAYDQYVQYLLTGANPSILNQHTQGYSLEGAGFPYSTPRPSQPTVLSFPPMGLARSPIYPNKEHMIPRLSLRGPITPTWSFGHLAIN
jgi:hypothetical protein